MFDISQIEKLLKVNGVPVSSPDYEIKKILKRARWHGKDIDMAVLILKGEAKNTKPANSDSLHKLFTTNDSLKPETISALLGIDMDVSSNDDIVLIRKRFKGELTTKQVLNIAFVSLSLSFIFVMSSMWYLELGIFYPAL